MSQRRHLSQGSACTSSQSYHLVYIMVLVPCQRLMNHVFSDIIDCYVLVYIDNILIYSKTADDHEKHLHKVFYDNMHISSRQKMQSVSLGMYLGLLSWSHSWVW